MDAPPDRMSPDEFNRFVDAHIEANYVKVDGRYLCANCGAVVQQATGYASIHATEFGSSCAGDGEVKRFPIPYCPNCEGSPTRRSTCVHIPMIPHWFGGRVAQ